MKKRFVYAAFSLTILCVLSSCRGSKQVTEIGKGSYYHDKFTGRQTASGEIYRKNKLTAAHPSLPFGTRVKVTNLSNGRSVMVRINDRGPFGKGRVIDLSKSAARKVGLLKAGVAKVKLEYKNP
jgi:rare lipoprotein A